MRRDSGVTLVELIIYVVILSIVAVIAVPTVGIISDGALKSGARELTYDIRYTKELNKYSGIPHKIVFRRNGYEIIDNTAKVVRDYSFEKGVFFEDYELNRGPVPVNYMSYTSDGMASASGSLIISNSKGTKKMKITITPVIGRVSLTNL